MKNQPHITRIPTGYRVRFTFGGIHKAPNGQYVRGPGYSAPLQKTFSDKKLGGKRKAFFQAKVFRDYHLGKSVTVTAESIADNKDIRVVIEDGIMAFEVSYDIKDPAGILYTTQKFFTFTIHTRDKMALEAAMFHQKMSNS